MFKAIMHFAVRLMILVVAAVAVLCLPALRPTYISEIRCSEKGLVFDVELEAFDMIGWDFEPFFAACGGGEKSQIKYQRTYSYSNFSWWVPKCNFMISNLANVLTFVSLARGLQFKSSMMLMMTLALSTMLIIEVVSLTIEINFINFALIQMKVSGKMLAYILIKNVCFIYINMFFWMPVPVGW